MDIVDRIKKLAKERGIKYSTIAAELGLNANFLNDVSAGKCRLNEARLIHIAQLLETSIEYLRGETAEKNKPTPVTESEPVIDQNELGLIIHFYKGFSNEGRKELMQKAFDIWSEEHSNS